MTTSVLISGAGIGGLTLAHALKRQGVNVQIVERTAEFRAAGAGITLSVNALNVFDRLGIGDRVRAVGRAIHRGVITDARGRTLQQFDFAPFQQYGVAIALHRSDLQNALLEGVTDAVRTGTEIQDVNEDRAGVTVTLSGGQQAGGQQERYDLVVGADGLRSRVRSLLFGNAPPRYAGYTSWRFVVPQEVDLTHPVESWGQGRRFGLVPLPNGQLYAFATLNAPREAPDPPARSAARLQSHFAGFADPVQQVLHQLTPDHHVIHTNIHEVTLRSWGRGRLTLLGDAAHAMTPNLGQGAGMSIEDAFVLAECLRTHEDVVTAARQYERQRLNRVRRVQSQSRLVGQLGQLDQPLLLKARDALMRSTPGWVTQRHLRVMLTGGPVAGEARCAD